MFERQQQQPSRAQPTSTTKWCAVWCGATNDAPTNQNHCAAHKVLAWIVANKKREKRESYYEKQQHQLQARLASFVWRCLGGLAWCSVVVLCVVYSMASCSSLHISTVSHCSVLVSSITFGCGGCRWDALRLQTAHHIKTTGVELPSVFGGFPPYVVCVKQEEN